MKECRKAFSVQLLVMKAPYFFKTSGNTKLVTQRRISEELNPLKQISIRSNRTNEGRKIGMNVYGLECTVFFFFFFFLLLFSFFFFFFFFYSPRPLCLSSFKF
jgi:hypothetical protein